MVIFVYIFVIIVVGQIMEFVLDDLIQVFFNVDLVEKVVCVVIMDSKVKVLVEQVDMVVVVRIFVDFLLMYCF